MVYLWQWLIATKASVDRRIDTDLQLQLSIAPYNQLIFGPTLFVQEAAFVLIPVVSEWCFTITSARPPIWPVSFQSSRLGSADRLDEQKSENTGAYKSCLQSYNICIHLASQCLLFASGVNDMGDILAKQMLNSNNNSIVVVVEECIKTNRIRFRFRWPQLSCFEDNLLRGLQAVVSAPSWTQQVCVCVCD